MKFTDNIDSTAVVSLDIESCRLAESYFDLSEEFQNAWGYKNKQDGQVPTELELDDLWKRNASLYAEFSTVVAVSLTCFNKDKTKLVCMELFGEDETAILTELAKYLDRLPPGYKILSHAGQFFDWPFLSKRFIINGMEVPAILDVLHLKPWEALNLIDSNVLWKMGGTGAGSSLQALCACLGIPSSKADMEGDEVGKAFFAGEYGRIGRYCSHDTVATFNVLRRLKKESVFTFEEVAYLQPKVVTTTGSANTATAGTPTTTSQITPEKQPESSTQNAPEDFLTELPLLQKLLQKGKLSKTDQTTLKRNIKPYAGTPEFEKIKAAILSIHSDFSFE